MIKALTTTVVLAASTLVAASTTHATDPPSTSKAGVVATFEGTTFDMSKGWGAANACNVTDTGVVCFRTEAAMERAITETPPTGRAANCSTSLRLYDGTSHTGAVISLSTRSSVVSLSAYGFDNRTSSYRVGACSTSLYNGIGTSQYGGNTSANASATSMASGWNNVISSVVIS